MDTSIVFGIILFLCSSSQGAKILGVFMTPSYSHQIVYQPIWKELSLRGHQVTVYTPLPLNDSSLSNLTEYDLGFSFEPLRNADKSAHDVSKLIGIYEAISNMQYEHQYLQDLIKNVKNESYDLLLVEYLWQSFYALKEVYNVPMVGITSLPLTISSSDALGIEKHPVVDPDSLSQFSYAETFKERVLSWGHNWIYRLMLKINILPRANRQIKKYFKNVTKSAEELAREVALVIGNYNFALQNIKPMTPNYITISAIHVHPQKPLPEDLADVLDNLKNDAIYFSLGTNVKASQVSKSQLGKLLKVLGRLPYTILWKYDTNSLPENLPTNFHVRKWFPQQDVLGHPRVKLFITQGGIQSIDEALSRRVPMLSIPFLGDQKSNADRCVRLGIAEMINFDSFSEEELETKLKKLLTDPSYQKNIDRQSSIANDQPMSSLDKAVFWIEYVLRHNGASHLKYAGVDLPFYKYYCLDVYLFLALILSLIVYVCRKIVVVVILSVKTLKRLVLKQKEKSKMK